MIRRLLLVLLALVAWIWLRRTLRPNAAGRARPDRPNDAGEPAALDTAMVRDRVCQTFIPKARALVLADGGETRYFCSERCRDTFLAEKSRA